MNAQLLSGERVLSPDDFDAQVRRAAAALVAEGIRPGDAVALLLRNDFAFFVAALAARRIGAFATPINWHATGEEIGYVLADCSARVLVGHDDLLARVADPGGVTVVAVPTPPEILRAYRLATPATASGTIGWDEWLSAAPDEVPLEQPGAPSVMIYTSGTTGKPKGVRRRPMTAAHGAAQALVLAAAYGLDAKGGTVVAMTGPMYHSAPSSYGLAAAGLVDRIVLLPRFEAEDLLAAIERHAITHMHVVPTMFVRLLKLPEAVRARYDVSSLRFVVHGAAPCPVEVKRAMIAWWGPVIHEYYGSTETGLVTSIGSVDALERPGSVGRALPGVDLLILDADGVEVAPGADGDIFVGTDNLPDFTYHGRQDERDAIGRAGRVTLGDVGRLDADGFLYLSDRRRDMIISGGVNIYPAEIEAALLAIPGVRDAAVFGIPDAEFGESVCAHVEREPGTDIDAAGIAAALGSSLARYKVPRTIEFAASLPREDSGKIFKRRLREPYWASAGRTI